MDAIKKWKWSILTAVFVVALFWCAWVVAHNTPAGQLKCPWIVVMVILVLLCILAGYMINGRIDGILIDERNRISLSRFQWVMWVIIIVGGYFTIAVWDVAHGGDLPKLDNQLLVLLGIVSASPILSGTIVDNKKSNKDAPQGPKAANDDSADQKGSADINTSVNDASWSDLFMGEEAANRYVVDISRLQNLVFTVILGITYLTWLCGVLVKTDAVLAMPVIGSDSNFNWLLGISHLAYQGFKASPKTPAPAAVPPAK
jgi:hypothetical protein